MRPSPASTATLAAADRAAIAAYLNSKGANLPFPAAAAPAAAAEGEAEAVATAEAGTDPAAAAAE